MADINKTRAQVAAIILSVGDVANLTTSDKTSLVAAINEVKETAGDDNMPIPATATEGNIAVFNSSRCVIDDGVQMASLSDSQAIIDDYE